MTTHRLGPSGYRSSWLDGPRRALSPSVRPGGCQVETQEYSGSDRNISSDNPSPGNAPFRTCQFVDVPPSRNFRAKTTKDAPGRVGVWTHKWIISGVPSVREE